MTWYRNRRDEQLWYEDSGTGCPVVLLHGWCMSSAVWKYQYDGLSAAYRLLAPDLRGHGRSHDSYRHLDFDSFAEDLADFFDRLELANVVLVGWSMGAQIALHASAGLSGRVAGLVLVSATPRFTATSDFPHGLAAYEASGMRLKVERNRQRALEGFISRLFAAGELDDHPCAAEIRQLLAEIPAPDSAALLDALESLTLADMRHVLATIAVPTLIINGAQDRICLPQASQYLYEHITGAGHTVMPECGHAPFLTRSLQFNTEIIRFARSVCATNTR
jgi:pimeloyl-[acyl-carrier protein] methyl ester esterase